MKTIYDKDGNIIGYMFESVEPLSNEISFVPYGGFAPNDCKQTMGVNAVFDLSKLDLDGPQYGWIEPEKE